jgi:hypothetical protein
MPAIVDRRESRSQPLAPSFRIDTIEFNRASAPAPQAEARGELRCEVVEFWILTGKVGGRIWTCDNAFA